MASSEIELMLQQEASIVDIVFKLVTGWMVFLMHPGWAMLETGSIRYESIPGVLNKNIMALCVSFIIWWIVGYSAASDAGGGGQTLLGSTDYAFQTNRHDWYFLGTFCATAVTIPSGAVAERMNVKFFAVYACLMSAIIYPAVSHWCWSGRGFLYLTDDADGGDATSVFGRPFMDFAGAGVVHVTGGVGALLGAIAVGPRKDRFEDPEQFDAHNISMVVLACLLMWFSWFGFNTGSVKSLHQPGAIDTALLVVANTTLAPCVCAIICWAIHTDLNPYNFRRKVDASTAVCKFCNGILAGCVSITGACGYVDHWAAVVIGMVGAFCYNATSRALLRWRVDDPLDAFAVHGACGLWSVIATGLFARTHGVFYGGGSSQLFVQLIGSLVIIAWSVLTSGPVFLIMRRFPSFNTEDVQDLIDIKEGLSPDEIQHTPVFPREELKRRSSSPENSVSRETSSASIISSEMTGTNLPCIYENEISRQQQHDLLTERIQDLMKLVGMRYTERDEIVSTFQDDIEERLSVVEQFHKELTVFRNGTVKWARRQDAGVWPTSSRGPSTPRSTASNVSASDPPPAPEVLLSPRSPGRSRNPEISIVV